MMHGWHIHTLLPFPPLSSLLQIPSYSCTNSHTVGKHTPARPPKTHQPQVHFVVKGGKNSQSHQCVS